MNNLYPEDPKSTTKTRLSQIIDRLMIKSQDVNFKPLADALEINGLLYKKPMGFKNILILWCQRTRDQRAEIIKSYYNSYSKELLEDIEKRAKEKSAISTMKMLTDPYHLAWCKILYSFIKAKKSVEIILLIHTCRSTELEKLNIKYQHLFERYLEDDIKKNFSGEIKDLLISSLPKSSRYVDVNAPTAREEAIHLIKNLENKCYIDNLISIFGTSRKSFLKEILEEFKDITKKEFLDEYKNKIKLPFYECLKMIEIITNGIPQAYALYFERNLTIDPEVCYPIILLRIEIDIKEICEHFKSGRSETLLKVCRDIYRDDKLVVVTEALRLYH